MSILFAGNEPRDFDVHTGSTNNLGGTEYSRVKLQVQGAEYFRKNLPDEVPEVWFKTSMDGGNKVSLLDQSLLRVGNLQNDVVRIAGAGTAQTYNAQRWNGSAWVTVGTFTYDLNVLAHLCLRVKTGPSGLIEFYKDGAPIFTWTGALTGIGGIQYVMGGTGHASGAVVLYHREVIVATHDVRTSRLRTLAVTGAGSTQQWQGTHLDIDAFNETDDSYVSSATAGQIALFAKNNLLVDTNEVDAIVLSGRFRRNDLGPTNVDGIIRSGGVNHKKAFAPVQSYFSSQQLIYATNPGTGSRWTKAEVEAAEIGFESKA